MEQAPAGVQGGFTRGQDVRALRPVRNDGTYPHREIGEILVHEGDAGCVREDWSFLGKVYYTVEFIERAVVALMRANELEKAHGDAPETAP